MVFHLCYLRGMSPLPIDSYNGAMVRFWYESNSIYPLDRVQRPVLPRQVDRAGGDPTLVCGSAGAFRARFPLVYCSPRRRSEIIDRQKG